MFAQAAEARRREIGIRMALGSSRAQIARLVLLTASKALAWGRAVGYVLSLMSVPILRRSLYGLSPIDPVAYAGRTAR